MTLLTVLAHASLTIPPAAGQTGEAWETPEGRTCIQQWITHASQVLNRHSGDADFNKRKPWSINQYGLFQAQGLRSTAAPDNWADYGADIYRWMWGHYTSEIEYPSWDNDNFEGAYLKGLRWFVRSCLESAVPATAATPSPSSDDTSAGSTTIALDPDATCPANFSMHQGSTLTIECYCAPDAMNGSVWGSGTYTSDSALCAAARHAGAVDGNGGMVRVKGAPGLSAYQGTSSNTVSTSNYGTYPWSYIFPGYSAEIASGPAACPSNMTAHRGTRYRISCHCGPQSFTGTVWGTDTYTDDSGLCAAALHAGAVSMAGGMVTAVTEPGLSAYTGSSRNGISSSNYGGWHGSFRFEP